MEQNIITEINAMKEEIKILKQTVADLRSSQENCACKTKMGGINRLGAMDIYTTKNMGIGSGFVGRTSGMGMNTSFFEEMSGSRPANTGFHYGMM
jgi:hypothetical protein